MASGPKIRFIIYYRQGSDKCNEILDLYDTIENPHLIQSIKLQDVDKLKQSLKAKGQPLPSFLTGVPLITTNVQDAKRRVWLGPMATQMMQVMVAKSNENMQKRYENMPSSISAWASEGHSGKRNESILKGHMVARTTANELGGTAASIVNDDLYYSERVGNKMHGSGGRRDAKVSESDIAAFYAEREKTAPRRLREMEMQS